MSDKHVTEVAEIPNVPRPQAPGRAVEVTCVELDLHQVALLGVGREVANLDVLEHALTKRCHGSAPWQDESAAHAAPPFSQGASKRHVRLKKSQRQPVDGAKLTFTAKRFSPFVIMFAHA